MGDYLCKFNLEPDWAVVTQCMAGLMSNNFVGWKKKQQQKNNNNFDFHSIIQDLRQNLELTRLLDIRPVIVVSPSNLYQSFAVVVVVCLLVCVLVCHVQHI